MITLANEQIICQFAEKGAELLSLSTVGEHATEYIWTGDPTWWNRHAPILFPVVGALRNNTYTYNGRSYTLPQHGFVRDMNFTCVRSTETTAHFELFSNETTKESYPFDFELYVHYALEGATLHCAYEVTHPGTVDPLIFALGAHPAFLLGTGTGQPHIVSSTPYPDTTQLLTGGLLAAPRKQFEHADNILTVTHHTFEHGALIFREYAPEHLTLERADGSHVTLSQRGFPHLGLWSKPGAPFVCIEPWDGYADPQEGYDGDISHKPGMSVLTQGRKEYSWSVRITPRA